jgi:hypothetical protein
MLGAGSIFFCGGYKPWFVMTLKEFLVTRVKMKVQAPMDAMLHPWFAIGRI